MSYIKNVLKYIVIGINIMLTMFFAGSYYAGVGIIMGVISIIMSCFLKENKVAYCIIKSQIKKYDLNILSDRKEHNSLLVSIAFLIMAVKIGAAIAMIVEGAAIILLAFCILLVSGWLLMGSSSGMSVGSAYNISRVVMKIYLLCNSLIEKLALLIVKMEFLLLKIEKI